MDTARWLHDTSRDNLSRMLGAALKTGIDNVYHHGLDQIFGVEEIFTEMRRRNAEHFAESTDPQCVRCGLPMVTRVWSTHRRTDFVPNAVCDHTPWKQWQIAEYLGTPVRRASNEHLNVALAEIAGAD